MNANMFSFYTPSAAPTHTVRTLSCLQGIKYYNIVKNNDMKLCTPKNRSFALRLAPVRMLPGKVLNCLLIIKSQLKWQSQAN